MLLLLLKMHQEVSMLKHSLWPRGESGSFMHVVTKSPPAQISSATSHIFFLPASQQPVNRRLDFPSSCSCSYQVAEQQRQDISQTLYFLETSQKLPRNFLESSQKLIRNSLETSLKLLISIIELRSSSDFFYCISRHKH